MKKLVFNLFLVGIAMIASLLCVSTQVSATEDGETEINAPINQVMIVQEEVEAREQPEETAAVVEKFAIGTPLLVTQVEGDNWYAVTYQEQILFVPQKSLQQTVESDELEQEFKEMEEEGVMIITAVEQYRRDRLRSRIWAGVIVALILGIFGVGIYGSIRNKREENKTEIEVADNKEKNKTLNVDNRIEIIDLDQE